MNVDFMFYFSKLMYKKFAPNARDDGLIYGNSVARYLSILTDLFLLMIFMRYYQYGFAKIFHSWVGNVDFNIMRKSQMNLTMTKEEIAMLSDFKFKYMIMNFSQLLVMPLYFYFPWYYLGGSFGQILVGLRIVKDSDGMLLNRKMIFKRLFASLTMPLTLMFGFLWSFIDKKRQSLHDKIVGTVIVTKASLKKKGIYNPKYDLFDIFMKPWLSKIYSIVKNKYDSWKFARKH